MKKYTIVSTKLFLIFMIISNPLGLDAKCKPNDFNTCSSNAECCSGFCYKEPGWNGVCRKKINSAGPMDDSDDRIFEKGSCTFYDGNGTWTTANGELYDGNDLIAAHRSLPFNTMVKVDIMGNSVIVRINDRRLAREGQILDLSAHAAEVMDITDVGPISCQISISTDATTCKLNLGYPCLMHHECCSRHCYKEMFSDVGVCT